MRSCNHQQLYLGMRLERIQTHLASVESHTHGEV